MPRASAVPRPSPMSGIPPSKSTKISEMRSRCRAFAAWMAPIAAATANESRPSGSTKASSFSTRSGSHDSSGLFPRRRCQTVFSATPATAAISATLTWSKPRSVNNRIAVCAIAGRWRPSRRRGAAMAGQPAGPGKPSEAIQPGCQGGRRDSRRPPCSYRRFQASPCGFSPCRTMQISAWSGLWFSP